MKKHRYSNVDRIDRILNNLRSPITIKGRPPVRWTLSERMEHYRVPGVSVAIIDDWKIIWSGGFGVKKAGTTDPVEVSTLFQAASISKPITATAILNLVDNGKLSLDEDVNTYLSSWKIPENNYTTQEKVTLRRILSHSAGLTVHGFPGYGPGQSIPDLQQILDGQPPVNTSAIRVDTLPGSQWRYSGGGFTVIQQLLLDIINSSFPLIMKQLILERANMSLSTFEQPLPNSRCQEAASGHDAKGELIEGNWHIYPEMAAAGLWTTSTELAQWALEITNAWNGRTSKLLSKSMAKQMMTSQKPPSGLGIFLEGTDEVINFSHGGGNEGFRSHFYMFPALGKGAVMMTNADIGDILIGEVLPSIAAEYRWPGHTQSERGVVKLETSQLISMVGIYTVLNLPVELSFEISQQDDRLFVEDKYIPLIYEIYATGIDEFISPNGQTILFIRDNLRQVTKMNMAELEAIRQ